MVDCRAIARAIADPENQPHQWNDQELAEFFVSAADEIERLREALKEAHHQLDYWQKMALLKTSEPALQQKESK